MPTVLAGQTYDLPESPEQITRMFIRDRWNLTKDGVIPARSDITFSLFGWAGRKSYQVSIEPFQPPILTQLNIGSDQWTRYRDPQLVHVYMIKNRDDPPPQMHHITQRVEQIVRENMNSVGYGITSIVLTSPFSRINEEKAFSGNFPNQIETSLWHSTATIELHYTRVTYGVKSNVRTTKTHKYNIEIED